MSSKKSEEIISASEGGRSSDRSSQAEASLTSLRTLKEEISEFIKRQDSNPGSGQFYPGTERADYDYAVERHNPYATNLLEAVSYLVKASLGAGILNMHEAFMFGGMLASGLGAFAIALLLSYSMTMLVTSAQKMYVIIRVSRLSYPDLGEAAIATGPLTYLRRYSKLFRYTIECFIFLELSGTCSIYQMMIAKTIKKISEFLFGSIYELQFSLRTYIFIVTVPLLLVCMIRKWKYLAPFSIIADLFLAICIITTMFYSMSEADNISRRPLWKSVPGLFKFFGICLYSMDALPLMLPIENNMRSPHHVRFVIHSGMVIIYIAVSLTGFFGYWGWGEDCKSPITLHLPLETVPIILQFLLVAMLTVTFAIQFWVPFRILWHYIGKSHDDVYEKRNRWERFYRIIYLLMITCLSTVFSHSDYLIIFLGDFFVSINSFIFPAVIESFVVWNQHRPGEIRWSVVKNILIFILGVVFCVGGLYSLYRTELPL